MAADIRCCYGSGSWLLPGTGVFWLGEGAKSWVVIFSQGWWVTPRFSSSWVDRRSVHLLNLRMNSGSSLHASARVNQNCLSSFSHSKLQFFTSAADWGQLLFVHWLCPRKGEKAGATQWWGYREITLPTPNMQNYHKPLHGFLSCCTLCVQPVVAISLWSLSEPQPLASSLCGEVFSLTARNQAAYNTKIQCLEFQTVALQIALSLCKIKQFVTTGSGSSASVHTGGLDVFDRLKPAAFQSACPAPWSCVRWACSSSRIR